MQTNNQKKVLLLIIALLLVANAVTLYWLYSHNRDEGKGRRNSISIYLEKELGFDNQQMKFYDSLRKNFRSNADSLFGKMRQEKEYRLNYLAAQGYSDSAIIVSAQEMADRQKDAEMRMLQHLREVRKIGNLQQQQKFDTTFAIFIGKDKKHPKH